MSNVRKKLDSYFWPDPKIRNMSRKPFKTSKKGVQVRDPHGRFIKGAWKGGPGRPRRDVELQYLKTFSQKVTPEVWAGIVEKAVELALKGEKDSRNWLSKYLLGDNTVFALLFLSHQSFPELGLQEMREKLTEAKAALHEMKAVQEAIDAQESATDVEFEETQ